MVVDDTILIKWQNRLKECSLDDAWVKEHQQRDLDRSKARVEICDMLEQFFSGTFSLEEFRTTFDHRTRTDWDHWGLKGLSGAMFLNKLAKHFSNAELVTTNLQRVLPAPKDADDGRRKLSAFVEFLNSQIKDGFVTKSQIQPARCSFFVSAIWQLQNTEDWPAFYTTARKALEQDGLYKATGGLVADYFSFRDTFLSLSGALGLEGYGFEHLCAWLSKPDDEPDVIEKVKNGNDGKEDDPVDADEEEDSSLGITHAQVQWILAKIGTELGCRIWIAKNDQKKVWQNDVLGEMSLDRLPNFGMGNDAQKTIELIDVLWLKGVNQIVGAFEVEHSTSVYSGLLRMSDLTVASPNLSFPLFIVAPKQRLKKVKRELSRPTFQSIELHRRCGYFSDERLLGAMDEMVKWGTDPSIINKLASFVDDVD